MHLKKAIIPLSLLLLSLVMSGNGFAFPRVFATGVTALDPQLTQEGYVLSYDTRPYFNDIEVTKRTKSPSTDEVLLINLRGEVVHKWNLKGYMPMRVRLLPNGNLAFLNLSKPYALAPQVMAATKQATDKEFTAALIEMDWSGKVVWRYNTFEGYHHDFRKLDNGNYIVISADLLPGDVQAKVQSLNNQWWPNYERAAIKLGGCTLEEVTPDGKVVWKWKSWEHLDINRFSPLNAAVDWTHGNTIAPLPANKYFDAGDKRFKPGNLIYNPRNLDMVCIIDKETGKVVWTYSGKYLGGVAHPHDTTMIPKGYPGEGNILIYDNGLFPRHRDHSGQSFILEVNPVSGETEWKYETVGYSNMRFFSKTNGVTQKLSGGNVFVTEDNTGRVFQIKPDKKHPDGGEIVWEYQHHGSFIFATFYPTDFCPQFAGLPKVRLTKITPVNPSTFELLTDEERKGGMIFKMKSN